MQKDYTKVSCEQIMDEVDQITIEIKRVAGLLKTATTEEQVDVITVYHDMLRKKADNLLRLYRVRAIYEAICT